MNYGLVALLATAGLLVMTGCGGPAGPGRNAVTFKVMFNNKPLDSGEMELLPVIAQSGSPNEQANAFGFIKNGTAEFNDINGPSAGEYKVRIVLTQTDSGDEETTEVGTLIGRVTLTGDEETVDLSFTPDEIVRPGEEE